MTYLVRASHPIRRLDPLHADHLDAGRYRKLVLVVLVVQLLHVKQRRHLVQLRQCLQIGLLQVLDLVELALHGAKQLAHGRDRHKAVDQVVAADLQRGAFAVFDHLAPVVDFLLELVLDVLDPVQFLLVRLPGARLNGFCALLVLGLVLQPLLGAPLGISLFVQVLAQLGVVFSLCFNLLSIAVLVEDCLNVLSTLLLPRRFSLQDGSISVPLSVLVLQVVSLFLHTHTLHHNVLLSLRFILALLLLRLFGLLHPAHCALLLLLLSIPFLAELNVVLAARL